MHEAGEQWEQSLQEQLTFLGLLTVDQRQCLPNWMVIAPPKTGTSWVFANLRRHPDAFAVELKELKYFSNRFELEDLRNYVGHFRRGIGKQKGEASPNYCLLPRRTIRLIKELIPDLKLVYLMRDPIGRAWSHARHSFRVREAGFRRSSGPIEDVSEHEWIETLDDDWNRLSGDYLGQLERWLSVFPRKQIYLGFFEEIVRSPRRLLRELLGFLELDPSFADSDRVTLERVNAGLTKDLPPAIEAHLQSLYGERTRELAAFLHKERGLFLPPEWERTRATSIDLNRPARGGRSWSVDDDALARLLAGDEMPERDFLGFHIVRLDAGFVACPTSLGQFKPHDRPPEWWAEQMANGTCLFAKDPYDLKSMIVRRSLAGEPAGSDGARLRQVEWQLDRVEGSQARLESSISEARLELARLERARTFFDGRFAALDQVHAKSADQLNVLEGALDRFEARLQSVSREQRQLAETLEALKRGHEKLARDAAICQKTRNELDDRLVGTNVRLENAEAELHELRLRVATWETGLIVRALRRVDSWLAGLSLIMRGFTTRTARTTTETAIVGSIVVGDQQTSQGKAATSIPVAENAPF